MKIEKLNDDKIRITLDMEDLKENDIDLQTFMSNSIESQELFMDMLEKAEKEVGFTTDDYRVMVEALAMSNGNFVLTVTRLKEKQKNTYKKAKINIKRKIPKPNQQKAIYAFDSFDEFCAYCHFLQKDILKNVDPFVTSSLLYELQGKYYLVLKNFTITCQALKAFASSITEFAHFVPNSDVFESKLSEYGTIIFEKQAILECLEHFCKNENEMK